MDRGVIISETQHGFVCANAGVDQSNIAGDYYATVLPKDPDASANKLRSALHCGPVIITDTFGRPWREGLVDVAIGIAGFDPLDDQRRPDRPPWPQAYRHNHRGCRSTRCCSRACYEERCRTPGRADPRLRMATLRGLRSRAPPQTRTGSISLIRPAPVPATPAVAAPLDRPSEPGCKHDRPPPGDARQSASEWRPGRPTQSSHRSACHFRHL